MTKPVFFKNIEILRGLAALAVCFFHFTCGNDNFLPAHSIYKLIGQYGKLGVEVFFVISGFILPFSMPKHYNISYFPNFIYKRLLRIEPPYLLSILVLIIINLLAHLAINREIETFQISLKQTILHLGYLNIFTNSDWLNPVFWTLAIEFQFYLIIGIMFTLLKNNRTFWLIVIISLILSLYSADNAYIFKHIPFFLLGVITYKLHVRELNIKSYTFSIILTLLFILSKFDFVYLIASIVPIVLIFSVEINSRLLMFFGKISFSLYLLHIPFGMKIINLSQRFGLSTDYKIVPILIAFIVSIFVSWIFYEYVEKHYINLSKKIKY